MKIEELEARILEIKKLPPYQRIKKMKELEKERKKELEKKSRSVIDDSIKEIEEEQQVELDKLEAAIKESEEQYVKDQGSKSKENLEAISNSDYDAISSYTDSHGEKDIAKLYNKLQNLGGNLSSGYNAFERATEIYGQIMKYDAESDNNPKNSIHAKNIRVGARKLMEEIGMYFAKDNNHYDP